MGGKSQKTSTQTTKLPAYIETAYQDLLSRAGDVSQTPYNPNTERNVAGFSAPQTQAFGAVQGAQGIQSPYLNQTGSYIQSGAAPISAQDIAQYSNPYQQQVIDATMAELGRSNELQQDQLVGNAALKNALGNSRTGVMQAELARGQGANTANILANLNQQNYNQALSAAQGDKSRQFQAASQYGALGNQAQNAAYQDINALLGIGGQQQQQQFGYDTATANAQQAAQYPFGTTEWLAGITQGLGGTAGGTTTATQPGPSALSQIAGIGLTAASLFSDERVKEDIEPVGSTFDGQPIYKFRYKGEPATHMGLMAQDVERRHPEAVGEVGGIKTVDYDRATPGFANGGWLSNVNSPMMMTGLGMIASDESNPFAAMLDGVQRGAQKREPVRPLFPEVGTALSGMFGGSRNLSGLATGGKVDSPPSHMDDILSRVQHAAQGLSAAKRASGGQVDVRKGIGRPIDMEESSPGQWEAPKRFANGGFFNNPYGKDESPDDSLLDALLKQMGRNPNAQVMARSSGYGVEPLQAPAQPRNFGDDRRPAYSFAEGFRHALALRDGDASVALEGKSTGGSVNFGNGIGSPSPQRLANGGISPLFNTEDLIKGFEGYAPVAKWDVRQHSGGYGTRAQPGERFTPEIAERRLREEIAPIDQWLNSNVSSELSPQQRGALTSFGFNLGVDDLERLLPDINRGDWETVANRMKTFNNVRNEEGVLEPSEGLTNRRMQEANLLYSPEGIGAPSAPPPVVTGGNEMARSAMVENAGNSVPEGLGMQPTALSSSPPQRSGIGAVSPETSGSGEWDINLPLLAAGLGILGSDSPFPGVAIGQGGMHGINMLLQQRQAKAAAQKLSDSAKAAQDRLGIQRESLEERKRHNLASEAQGSRAALSKNVIWGSDAEGNSVVLQASPEGKLIRSELPEGVTPIRDTIRVDAGDRWVLLDPVTRQKVGEEPKNLREAASETAAGGVEGKARQEAKATLPTVRTTTKRVLGALDTLDKSPIRESFTGYSGYLPNTSPEANDYQALLDQVAGNVFLTAFNDLRGGGAITEAEGQKATASLSRLGAVAPSDEGYQAALDDTRMVITEILGNSMRRAGASEEEIQRELEALTGGSAPASEGTGYKVLKVE